MGLTRAEEQALLEGGADLTVRDYGEDDPLKRSARLRAALFGGADTRPEQIARLAAMAPGLDRVLAVMSERLDPFEIHGWLTTPNPDLFVDANEMPMTVVAYLTAGGDPAPVIEAASMADILC